MKKIIIGGLLGGLVFYIWQSFSWMMLPWHMPKNIPDPDPVFHMLQERITEPGVYHFPGWPDELDNKNLTKEQRQKIWSDLESKFQQGPRMMQMIYDPSGGPYMNPGQFILGGVINIILGLIVAYLLSLASLQLPGYGQRVLFVALVGLFASIAGPVTNWNWWLYPAGFIFAVAVDMLIGWALAGLVIARIVRLDEDN